MKKTSSWRLENGARIGTLEQLVGSTSLGGTIASVFSLRLYNALAPTLLLIWALSPIGGQSSLHLVTAGTRHEFSTVNVTYFDTRSESVFAQNDQSVIIYLQTTNAVFQTSMMEPLSATSSRRDLWGNVKIPVLSSIAPPNALMSSDWTNIAFGQNLSYSSLLGIPLSGLTRNGRTNMTLETSYLTLTQVEPPSNITNLNALRIDSEATSIDMNNGTWHWAAPEQSDEGGLLMAIDGFNAADGNYSLWYNIYDRYSVNTEFEHHAARYLVVYSNNFNYKRFYMLSTTYVEAAVSYDGLPSLCQPTAIRASQQPHINSNLTNLAYSDTWMVFCEGMMSAVLLMQSGIPTITEAFMNDPSTAAETAISFGTSDDLYSNLTATDHQLETRAQQLINTYWQASVNPALATVGLKVANISNEINNTRTRSVEATNEISIDIYRVNWAWWVAFMCATSIMFALACLTLMIDCFLQGPEVLGYCTTFLRDSPFAINAMVLEVQWEHLNAREGGKMSRSSWQMSRLARTWATSLWWKLIRLRSEVMGAGARRHCLVGNLKRGRDYMPDCASTIS
jgi:hypothetical protein